MGTTVKPQKTVNPVTGIKLLPLIFVMMISCQYGSDSDLSGDSGEGAGGSMARFAISGNNLFTVDQTALSIFDLANPKIPVFQKKQNIGIGIETIFPLNNKLFLGTSTGMYIYDISSPTQPQEVSFYEHVYSCDPVVSDGSFAYVTLNSTNQVCWRSVNELQIINLQELENPQLVKQYTLEGPKGLAIRNDTLWVCDNGIKIFDVKNKQELKLLAHFTGIDAYDVIVNGNLAMVIGESGFTQYRLENGTFKKLSEINIQL